MENKETKSEEMLLIHNIFEKESLAGRKFFSIETDKGNYSCFEYDLVQDLKKNLGKKVTVEIAKNERGFQNIRKLISVVEIQKINNASSPEKDNFTESRAAKDTSIYTSYAKDLCIAIMEQQFERDKNGTAGEHGIAIMNHAIDLIKQAKEAFK